jgi:hypothetical protein
VIGGRFEVDKLLGELDGIDGHYGKDNRRAGAIGTIDWASE